MPDRIVPKAVSLFIAALCAGSVMYSLLFVCRNTNITHFYPLYGKTLQQQVPTTELPLDMYHKGACNLPWTSPSSTDKLLTLFTTMKDVDMRRRIHNRTLINWISLSPFVTSVLFIMPNDSTYWGVKARELGWRVEMAPKVREGVPVLKDMFQRISKKYPAQFLGYANADNLFGCSLLETLETLSLKYGSFIHKEISLIIGRRRNAKEEHLPDKLTAEYVDPAGPSYDLHPPSGVDYFIVSHASGYYWDRVPDFVVGRIAYDNWIVAKALEWNVTVIDVTATVTDIHQVGKDGIKSGFYANEGHTKYLNNELIGKTFNTRLGYIDCASWTTENSLNKTEFNLSRKYAIRLRRSVYIHEECVTRAGKGKGNKRNVKKKTDLERNETVNKKDRWDGGKPRPPPKKYLL